MNNLSLIARLTREPETQFTTSGKSVTNFGVAYDMGFGDKKRACFLDCKLWGDRGETFAKYVQKGHSVALTGSLDMESWQDKQTQQKRSKHVLDVRDFTLLNNKREGEASPPQERGYGNRPAPRPQQQRPADDFADTSAGSISEGMEDDDIPF